jgi:hypothetical protein
MRGLRAALAVIVLGIILSSCGGDPTITMRTNPEARARIMGAIASDSALVGRMADTLLHEDRARDILVEKVATNGEAMQALMAKLARDPVAVDGIIGFAVQESTMKQHVLTLLKGIEIGGGRR